RRSFILLSGLGISSIAVSIITFLGFDFFGDLDSRPESLSQICDDETLMILGQAYLKLYPDERNSELLMKELYGDFARRRRIKFKNSIKLDFHAGKTVILNGWILSVTEARQCALFNILTSSTYAY
ncbi:MAG TPA: hypothetical protein VFO54_06145, partial [Chryseosolibacter sp.]|nr:hypothetical protein [Chryseosolibacter sp.]